MARFFSILFLLILFVKCSKYDDAAVADQFPGIYPDYSSTTIPYNIAPLNFKLVGAYDKCYAEIYGDSGRKIKIRSDNGKFDIPLKKWKHLLKNNIDKNIYIDLYTRNKNGNLKYETINIRVSGDPVDPYIVYRKIGVGYILWNEMGIYQRCTENFKETPVMLNKYTDKSCVNCHSFNNFNPAQMVLHLRQTRSGTIIINGNKKQFLNTVTDYTMSAGVYPAWHPSGKYIAFSVNKIYQLFPANNNRNIVVEDNASDLVLLETETNVITTSPKVCTPDYENLPAWSPDGEYLYYISGKKKENGFEKIKYSLVRIPFNTETKEWGDADTLISAANTCKSITHPGISPDGKYILFCMADKGYFTVYNESSDIYIMNTETRKYKELNVNSEFPESTPVWSSNGKWIMFVSKRNDNTFSKAWFSHIDENGNADKPFVLPQQDADFYINCVKNFNIPEFVKSKVDITPKEIYNLTREEADPVLFDKNVDIDALSGATKIKSDDDMNYYHSR